MPALHRLRVVGAVSRGLRNAVHRTALYPRRPLLNASGRCLGLLGLHSRTSPWRVLFVFWRVVHACAACPRGAPLLVATTTATATPVRRHRSALNASHAAVLSSPPQQTRRSSCFSCPTRADVTPSRHCSHSRGSHPIARHFYQPRCSSVRIDNVSPGAPPYGGGPDRCPPGLGRRSFQDGGVQGAVGWPACSACLPSSVRSG
jgi:hypothetical protein